ncbi:MAG: FAD-dependent oxidoreductase [Vicinamibacterales bacterium]
MRSRRLLLVAALAGLAAVFVAFDLDERLSLEALKGQRDALRAAAAADPVRAAATFVAVYVAVTALSLPGAAALTLAGGAIFGFWFGLGLVSVASTAGATLAFLAARFVLRDAVQARFGERLRAVNDGVRADGAWYLLSLRLVPLFPFFVVNVVMALTPIRTWTFAWVSQLGMLLGTAVFVNAGIGLAAIDTPADVVSPGLLFSFVLLGLAPLAGRGLAASLRRRRVYAPWAAARPRRFDRNVVVIGGGSAGLVAAYLAAALKASVTLVERERLGGDCLYTGCVPSKTLIRAAAAAAEVRRAASFGVRADPPAIDFAAVMARVRQVITAIEPHDSVARYTALGVECARGHGRLVSPWAVEITDADGATRTLTTRAIVIAAGARPILPPIPGLAEAGALTSATIWSLDRLPSRLVVLGGGPIGCELAQAFARLGSQVTIVEAAPQLLAAEDADCAALVQTRLAAEGVALRLGQPAVRVDQVNGEKRVVVDSAGAVEAVACDEILCAVGRVAVTDGLGLEALGIATTAARAVALNEWLETRYPNVVACGDVAGPYQFTHMAAHTARFAVMNALFGWARRFRVDYSVVPWVTFTDPQVARVGLNEDQARARGVPHVVTTYALDDLDRAIADGSAHGLVKVLTAPGSDRILGATIVGAHAGEMLPEFVLAMTHRLGLSKLLDTIHVYPTFAEANKYAAGVWRRSGVTRGQHTLLAALHAWRRRDGSLGGVVAAVWPLWRDRRPAASGADRSRE